jgi:hypothetical protein
MITEIGAVPIKVPRVRGWGNDVENVRFTSAILSVENQYAMRERGETGEFFQVFPRR